MFENTRSHAVLLARCGAIVFALSACGYLVVTAQRNANPVAVETPTIVEPVSTAITPAQNEMYLYGSKSLVLDAAEVVELQQSASAEGESMFLSSSKTLNWTAHPNPPPLYPPIPAAAEPQPGATEFLPSSKVGVIATPEPVFMPSSKSLRIDVTKPAATKPAPAPPKNL